MPITITSRAGKSPTHTTNSDSPSNTALWHPWKQRLPNEATLSLRKSISSPRTHPLLVIRNDVVAKEENDMNSLNLPIDTVSSMGHFSIEHVLKHRKEKSPILNSLTFGHFSSTKDPSRHSLKQLSQMTTFLRPFIPTIFRLFAHMKE